MASENVRPLRRRQKVVAAVDLPGVPAGTYGRIQLVNGFSWVRYRVHFDNGEELGFLDRDQLVTAKERKREGAA
ncbi:MAG: hypothetical protein FJW94_03320 [Actinobacteria bacterium]|nr:hypothetical protein [Actinomycetota bacterium]